MMVFILDCLEFLLRWLHVIAGIAWIGSSFYFVWLDSNLDSPPKDKEAKGVLGDLWSIHGGGIYEIAKYKDAPPSMPSKLHWFKWEAYSTWITGMLLMIVFYYIDAQLYLVGGGGFLSLPSHAIAASLGFLVIGVCVYEALMRSLGLTKPAVFSVLLVLFILAACWVSCFLFGARAAFLHVGAMLGTIMAGNVFLGIIPAQKYFVACLDKNEKPDLGRALEAKTRSVNNNYLTLPVIFCMISNHYSFLYGHPFNWLLLFSIMGISAYARHFFNLKNQGIFKPIILIISLFCFVVVMSLSYVTKGYNNSSIETPTTEEVLQPLSDTSEDVNSGSNGVLESEKQILTLVKTFCQECHASHPTSELFSAAPAGIILDNYQHIIQHKPAIIASVSSGYMPLGNLNGMTQKQRNNLLNLLTKE